ncbi:MAG: DUF423 domain-containing protein [Marinilabiliales bacterium]|nr:MAG: DUF423 domain-containing protein [Marinilabiliales bacterium]
MTKRILITVGISGALSVILGAFGSHLLNGSISHEKLEVWNTAVQYQMYHTIALLGITFMNRYLKRAYISTIYYLFFVGIIMFSGSLYIVSISEITGLGLGPLKYITPLGGLLLIIGWIYVILSGLTYEHNKRRHKS